MKLCTLTAMALGTLFCIGEAFGAEGDGEKILGAWKVVASEDRGRKIRDEELKDIRLVFTKDRIVTKVADRTGEESLYKLDSTKNPGWIDIARLSQDGKPGDPVLGIYELSGDDLKICHAERRKGERANAFESKPDSPNVVLIILKREKP